MTWALVLIIMSDIGMSALSIKMYVNRVAPSFLPLTADVWRYSYLGSNSIFFLSSLEMRILASFANGLTAVCDIAISATLCYYLHSKRTGFKRQVWTAIVKYYEITVVGVGLIR